MARKNSRDLRRESFEKKRKRKGEIKKKGFSRLDLTNTWTNKILQQLKEEIHENQSKGTA